MADSAPVKEINALADKDADSVDSDVRYMAYGARLRTALRAGQRYIAYVCRVFFPSAPCSDRMTSRPVTSARPSAPWCPLRS